MVASFAERPRWLTPGEEAFELWKEELRPRLVEADQAARLEDFPGERTLIESGHDDLVGTVRLTFQDAVQDRFKRAVEEAVGRRVLAYHSQVIFDPPMGFEVFVLEPSSPRPRPAPALPRPLERGPAAAARRAYG